MTIYYCLLRVSLFWFVDPVWENSYRYIIDQLTIVTVCLVLICGPHINLKL